MATYQELYDDVVTVTKRPDLAAETALAIRAATLKLHQSDFYFKDLFETGIQFVTAEYFQQLELATVIPRFRAFKYLRRYDNNGAGGQGAAAEFYSILTPAEILDDYGCEKSNIAYVAGATLNIKAANPLQYLLVGVYLNPNTSPSNFVSWIAQDHPFAIVFEAIRVLFKQIGYDEQATAYERLAAEQLAEVKISGIQAVGY